MRDLTHYFVSPKKSRENGSGRSSLGAESNVDGMEVVKSDDDGSEDKKKKKKAATTLKKRSRVKIKISVNEAKNRRCDIIENENDVVDKTPSPLKRRLKTNTNIDKNLHTTVAADTDDVAATEQTPDAFKMLMNRGRPSNVQRDAPETAKEHKAKPNRRKEGKEQTKRKLDELEEAESVESRKNKRAKVLAREEKRLERGKSKLQNVEKKKKGRDHNAGNNNNETLEKHGSLSESRNQALTPLAKELTPKSKTKWTMRVKLQSNSDDEKAAGENRNSSDDDYIFTPKSKVKFHTTRVNCKGGEDRGVEEEKPEPVVEIDEDNRRSESIKVINGTEPTGAAVASEKPGSKNVRQGKYRTKKNRSKLKSPEVYNEDRSGDVSLVVLDDNSTNCGKVLAEKKLAPLFVKRSKMNPAALEARRSFLQSGIPDHVKKVISEQKSVPNDVAGYSTMPFPLVSHVTQAEIVADLNESNSSSCVTFYRAKAHHRSLADDLVLDPSQFRSLSNFGAEDLAESAKMDGEKLAKIERGNFESVLKDIESRCSDTRQIWESVSSTFRNRTPKKSPKKRNKKLKLQRKSDTVENDDRLDDLNWGCYCPVGPTWTCKYKPTSSVQVVGNEDAIAKLRNWLNGWRLPAFKDDYSSGDEFYSSDCSSSGSYENNQVAVLLGPHGSGKSASVYAIAEELGYRVLEVNASSKRTGKKILSDFQEATKSHRVKRDQTTLLPIRKKPSEKKVPQNSLILIEDVDLIFEEDEGFVSATFQLAANTKRPIVMTCKEPCSHLYKMAPQQQFIHFQTATGNRVAALLELIALAESGYRLPKSCLNILLRNGDLRQSLLQLQYILLSGPPAVSQLGVSAHTTLWQDMHPLVYKPALRSSKKCRKESSNDKLFAEQETELIKTLTKKLDNIALISLLTDVENPAPPPWSRKLNPSLSFLEDFKPYSNTTDLSVEIAEWLRLASLDTGRANPNRDTNTDFKSQTVIKRKVKLGIDSALSQAVPSTLEHRSKAIDYLPAIRTMCRAEQDRAKINTKRGNRFHNYLHGLNLVSASSNILAAASSVFQEKSM